MRLRKRDRDLWNEIEALKDEVEKLKVRREAVANGLAELETLHGDLMKAVDQTQHIMSHLEAATNEEVR